MSAGRVWKTEKAQLLDSEEFRTASQRASGAGIPGTGKRFNSETVATQITDIVVAELDEPGRGTNIETALTALGALAGFSAQMAIREYFIKAGKITEEKAFATVKTKDGSTYFFGDLLNEPLISTQKGQFSIWNFVAGAAQSLGAKELPDLNEIFSHVANTVGTDKFGVPRLLPRHMPHAPPFELLNKFWNPIRNHLAINTDTPGSWPYVLGQATQILMIQAKGVIDPALAAKVVMESVIPMSKCDPASVHHAYFSK
jgi:hypothetical protein